MRKAASRFSKPRLSNALHLWYDKVQEGKIELQRDKHLDRVLSRLPSRRWRIQLDSAWCIWARYTYRKRQFGRTALMIRSRRARNALCHAWESISLLYSVKRDSRRAVDKYTLMSNFLNRPRINTGVGVVFIKSFWNWAALSARYRTLKRAAVKVIMRMRYGGAISALHAWNVFSSPSAALRARALSSSCFLGKNGSLASAK